jgi:hypothetical protein
MTRARNRSFTPQSLPSKVIPIHGNSIQERNAT